jgi:hypothetical protein
MTEPHKPMRGDDVELWLKRQREQFGRMSHQWRVVNELLDRYRWCSDYGLTLRPEDDHRGDP